MEYFAVIALLIFILGSLLRRTGSNKPMKKASFHAQYETFKKLGFELNPGITPADIYLGEGDKKFEKVPYELMYIRLGGCLKRAPHTPLTDRCWLFDTEAIEGHGSYVRIIENLQRITRCGLSFENIRDVVEDGYESARVSFTLGGEDHSWLLNVHSDWVDPELFARIADLTKRYDSPGRFTYYPTGQCMVIGFETPETLKAIRKETGLAIDFFKGSQKDNSWN